MFDIGVAGQMQNGKDTLADYLVEKLDVIFEKTHPLVLEKGWKRTAFANGVKDIYCKTFNVDRAFIEEWKTKPEPPPGFDMPVRQGLQFIGDGFRKIQSNIWVDLAFRDDTPKIISDVRYLNEVSTINYRGGINILVWRPGSENDDSNGSEAQIRPAVEWFKKTGMEGTVVLDMKKDTGGRRNAIPVLEEVLCIDLFIRNDGSKEDLYQKVDNLVVPYVKLKFGL